ncbi:MAG: phosphate acetyltransferase [Gammaproteobacteria bacterium]|nr:phosphate acetyltransferase [Gammaproteobacteria bacterium]
MGTLDRITETSRSMGRRIVLPESGDRRVIQAASIIARRKIARAILVGNPRQIADFARQSGTDISSIDLIDPRSSVKTREYQSQLLALRKHKGMTEELAATEILDPLVYAACMVRNGDAEGCVAGAAHTTSDVVRRALQVIGMEADAGLVSSFMIMEHERPHQAIQGTALYADCALVIDPDAEQLAGIAIATADSGRNLVNLDPRVALLSFSTSGSASHPHVEKVRKAGEIISRWRPDIPLMAEVQFDAAVIPRILRQKAPGIQTRAPANVFVFPDLQSANIGYKIAQRIGGVRAVGPVLQGLKHPVNDLSRGCSVDDIVQLIAITSVQSGAGHGL